MVTDASREVIPIASDHAGVGLLAALVAELAREHNDSNVLVLPARFVSDDEGLEILRTWLATAFEGGRHGRQVAKIDAPEPA